MKKLLIIFSCWLLGLVPNMAQQRKIADVQHLADSILNRPTRFGKRVKTIRTQRIIAASELRNAQQNGFYICEAGDDGYAVISADERMNPVLGFSQNRRFDTDNIPAGLQELLSSYTREYEALTSGKPARLVTRRIEGVKEQVGPLFTTQWGQGTPFNTRCPELNGEKCITGCVAISTSQTLYYYQYPDSATGTVNYVSKTNKIPIQEDLSTFKFNWPYIKSNYKNEATTEERNEVANLVYACAAAVQMDFGIKESGATSINQVKALVENFGYDPDIACIRKDYTTTNEWQTLMLNELNNERPIIYSAKSPTVGGHSFIVDGYKADENGYPFYHVNWGWEGYCDDFYKLSAMDADGDEYSQSHEAIIYLMPDNKQRDSEVFWQAQDAILKPARINPKDKQNFTITLNNLFNYSYKTFNGKFEFYLEDVNHKEILVATQNIYNVPFCYGMSTMSVDATLPENIAEGDYTLIIRSKTADSNKYETVTYSPPVILTVSSITEYHTPKMAVKELTNKGEDWNGLSMATYATYPLNTDPMPFTGWLQMAVTNEEGSILLHFGSVYYINGLEQGQYLRKGITFSGQLPDNLDDGKYYLCLAANQNGYLEWGKVTGFNGEDLSIPFLLEDRKITYPEPESEPIEYYANLQATDMSVKSFDPYTRQIDMQMTNVINRGDDPFKGVFSMVVYDEKDSLLTEFGETVKVNTELPRNNYFTDYFNFSGNLPNELTDGVYTVKIAAKQNGCIGWSPIKGWNLQGTWNIDLHFDFHIMNNIMYDTDGYTSIENVRVRNEKSTDAIYDLSGRKVNSQLSTLNSQLKKGIYIVNGRKVVR